MSGAAVVSGWLLALGPVVGLASVAQPSLLRVWSMPREQFVATVAAHRTAWAWLNGGFVVATVTTTGGLVVLATEVPGGTSSAWLLACALAYGIGGGLWCAVLAIRTRTTPLLADLGPDAPTSREAALLDAATTGLFQAFVLLTSGALAALGLSLLLASVVTAAVAVVVLLVGAAGIVWLLVAGDVIPAVLYVPTLILGIALLTGGAGALG